MLYQSFPIFANSTRAVPSSVPRSCRSKSDGLQDRCCVHCYQGIHNQGSSLHHPPPTIRLGCLGISRRQYHSLICEMEFGGRTGSKGIGYRSCRRGQWRRPCGAIPATFARCSFSRRHVAQGLPTMDGLLASFDGQAQPRHVCGLSIIRKC